MYLFIKTNTVLFILIDLATINILIRLFQRYFPFNKWRYYTFDIFFIIFIFHLFISRAKIFINYLWDETTKTRPTIVFPTFRNTTPIKIKEPPLSIFFWFVIDSKKGITLSKRPSLNSLIFK